MAVWPDATTTGVPDGVTLLPSGDIVVTKAGTVISGLNITGSVYIDADNVTLQNCKISSSNFAVVQIQSGSDGVTVKNCEINGLNSGGTGISGKGSFIGNDIYGVGDGINVIGDHVLIQDNYIHDLGGTADSHFDGIQVDGNVSDLRIEHNTIINDHGQTAAVMIDDYFGPTSNVVVNNNLLTGGGYTIYVTGLDGHGTTNVQVTNNHIGGGQWGETYFAAANPVFTGNVSDGNTLAAQLGSQDTSGSTPTPPPVTTPPIVTAPSTAPTEGADALTGTSANNAFNGKGGNDTINGMAGNDTINGGAGYDVLTGGAGNDTFAFSSAAEIGTSAGARDIITDFTQGQDKIDLSAIDANSKLTGDQDFTFIAGNNASFTQTAGELAWHTDTATGRTIVQGDINGDGVHDFEIELKGLVNLKASDFIGAGATSSTPTPPDTGSTTPPPVTTPPATGSAQLLGTSGIDRLTGDARDNYIDGKAGSDVLKGEAGNDTIYGGAGRDVMTGGTGNDTFLFKAVSDMGTTAASRDVITDFVKGQDKIDLSAIDANSRLTGDQAFSFLAGDNQAFTHKVGEVAWHIDAANNQTVIQGDMNGDGVHDFEIQLTGQIHLGSGDFIM
jgi:Ca2+-binding RTX toxin-like protein